jgi:hypothetical protein
MSQIHLTDMFVGHSWNLVNKEPHTARTAVKGAGSASASRRSTVDIPWLFASALVFTFIFFSHAGNQTQGFGHAEQALYH